MVRNAFPVGVRFRSWLRDDAGATTAEFLIVSAAVVGFGLGAVAAVRSGLTALGVDVSGSVAGTVLEPFIDIFGSAPEQVIDPAKGGDLDNFEPTGCAGGLDAVREYARIAFDVGRWEDGVYDYNFADLEDIIAKAQSYDDDNVIILRENWFKDYQSTPEAFSSSSVLMVELAVAECVAVERGLVAGGDPYVAPSFPIDP